MNKLTSMTPDLAVILLEGENRHGCEGCPGSPCDVECPIVAAHRLGAEALKAAQDNKTFTREELEAWLYAIAANNLDGVARDRVLASDCEEIIGRLDGFERFVKDRREGKI